MPKKGDQLKDQSVAELNALYRDLSKEIFNLTNEFKITRKIEKPHLIKTKKRERARVLTFLRQKGGTITY
jgi:large subunit ribosomal protein L29